MWVLKRKQQELYSTISFIQQLKNGNDEQASKIGFLAISYNLLYIW